MKKSIGPGLLQGMKEAQMDNIIKKHKNTFSKLHDCQQCGNLKVVWVDMWETNCPKCSPVKS